MEKLTSSVLKEFEGKMWMYLLIKNIKLECCSVVGKEGEKMVLLRLLQHTL